jgi:hypothetical protein
MFAKLRSLQKNVTTAGTDVQLTSTATNAYAPKIKAKTGNTGFIYVGVEGVSATTGYELDADQVLDLSDALGLDKAIPIDLSLIWLDSSVNGEGVCVSYLETYKP